MRGFFARRLPTLDAALTRFDAWWAVRSPRERLLFATMTLLILGVILTFGAIRPLEAARAERLAHIHQYETYNARLRAAGSLAPSKPPRTGAPIAVVTGAATSYGLTVAAEPIANGVRATLADGSYDAVMAWLGDLGGTSRLRISFVTILKRPEPGHVSAVVEFAA